MEPHPPTHNELLFNFWTAEGKGAFAEYEWVQFFSGRFDQPVQVAMRNRNTGRMTLIDLYWDGSFGHLPD